MLVTMEKWQDIAKLCRQYEALAEDSRKHARTQANEAYYRGKAHAYADIAELIEKGWIVIQADN